MHFIIETPYSLCLTRRTMYLLYASRPVPHPEMHNSVPGYIVIFKLKISPRQCVIIGEVHSFADNKSSQDWKHHDNR